MITLPPDVVLSKISKRWFFTLATTSTSEHPHVAGVLYSTVGTTFYVTTPRDSRKARNIADNPRVGVCIPVRRLPVGPPAVVMFQANAEILAVDDPHVVELVERGELKRIVQLGEGDDSDNCFLRITPSGRILTFGLGMPLWRLIRDPHGGAGETRFATSPSMTNRPG